MGLWTYAKEFLDAAKAVAPDQPAFAPGPAYYLVCHSIELALKAFLRGAGESLSGLKAIGHDLELCIKKAEEKGISRYHGFTQEQKAAIALINGYYSAKELEYITTGFKRFPEYGFLEATAAGLLGSIKVFCQDSRRIHE